jgi:hypothetical protein
MDWLSRFSASVAAGIFINYVLVPMIMSTALGAIVRLAFGKLKERKEKVAFALGSFVLFLTLIFAIGTRSPQPVLAGGIQSVMTGNLGGNDRDTIAAFTVNVINTGSMQTIVKNWKVTAESNGRKYEASFPAMPDSFTFNNIPATGQNQPTAITYYKSESLLERSLKPIEVGSILPGVLFVLFQNVDAAVFRTGVDYTVTYEDVLSRQYSMEIRSSGSMGTIGFTPGVKMDATCPIPPGGLPKLGNNVTTGTKTVPSMQ